MTQAPTDKPTLASLHADPSKGWRAVPRWFRRTDFWKGLSAAHRAVLDELFHRIASKAGTHKGTGITFDRGEWPIGEEALGNASGATRAEVRTAIRTAHSAGVLTKRVATRRVAGRTIHLSVFKWLDFDSYDRPKERPRQSLSQSLDHPLDQPLSLSLSQVRHSFKTPSDDTTGKTRGEETAASPPDAGLTASGGDVLTHAAPSSSSDALKVGESQRGEDQQASLFPSAMSPAPADGQPGTTSLTTSTALTTGLAVGEARTAADSSKPRKARKSSPAADPTDDEKKWARSSVESMVQYLVYGRRARTEPVRGLKPSSMDWGGANDGRPNDGATIPQLAGYAWWRVSQARERLGVDLDLPDTGRLIGAIKAAKATRTQDETVKLIDVVTSRWPEIVAALPWMAGLTLDEATLQKPHVIDVAKRLLAGQPAVVPAAPRSSEHKPGTNPAYAHLAWLNDRIEKPTQRTA